MKKIAIVGGTGFVGQALIKSLTRSGYFIHALSRKGTFVENETTKCFAWNIERKEIDINAFDGIDAIVYLAGANVAAGRWTRRRKETLRASRIDGLEFIRQKVVAAGIPIRCLVSASAVGYYGFCKNSQADETTAAGNDFLSTLCQDWENEAMQFGTMGARVAILRIGIVVGQGGGLLQKMAPLARIGLLSPLGNGRQPMPWISLADICGMCQYAIENPLNGIFNAVSPRYETNKTFSEKLAKRFDKTIWLPNVPAFLLKSIYGEMSAMLLSGTQASPQKIIDAGFQFECPELELAIK